MNDIDVVNVPDSLLFSTAMLKLSGKLIPPQSSCLTPFSTRGREKCCWWLSAAVLLARKWSPHDVNFVGKPVFHIVVPEKSCTEVLKAAHDQLGHFGVRKMYSTS